MASTQDVKQYLAYWFQLGKRVITHSGNQSVLPRPVIRGNSYSQEFEDCWSLILSPESKDCYLEGTEQTISDLLESNWQVNSCARCGMPVPMPVIYRPTDTICPCFDLPFWPDSEMPQPRKPIDTKEHLSQLRSRLQNWKPRVMPTPESTEAAEQAS